MMHVRVIAPSRTFKIIGEETRKIANERLKGLGIDVSYSKHSEEMDGFLSSSIKSRADDLNEAFADKSVDMILTAIGGYNSNEILPHIDYDLIKKNPKVLSGFSDITALSNAIYAKTGMITYSGPHFSSFGMKKGFDYTLEYFKKCVLENKPFEVAASKEWSDDAWFMNQEKREFIDNDGHWVLNSGKAEGRIIGGNLGTIVLLQGTEYMPSLKDVVLFIEECAPDKDVTISRNLTSLLQQTTANIKAVVIGRFQKETKMTRERLAEIIATKEQLKNIPIIANVDFGHTTPMITFPIGGRAKIDNGKITISK